MPQSSVKSVTYTQNLFRRRALGSTIDRLALLRQSGVDFIPIGSGKTIRTSPILEDSSVNWAERYVEAAIIYLTNPLCFAAQNLINDELADARFIVEEKQGYKWVEHSNNRLAEWMPRPNSTMDFKELVRAYSTHYHTFGSVYGFMFQKGDYLPSGMVNHDTNCFDIIFPGRIAEDRSQPNTGVRWWYQPLGFDYDNLLLLNQNSLFVDVLYNPVGHGIGVSLPNNPLRMIFKIHNLYMRTFEKFFTNGAMPRHILSRAIDIQKDTTSLSLTDDQIDEAVQRIYRKVGLGGENEQGLLGLRGDWRLTKVGTDLPDLVNKELLHLCDTAVGAVYKVPSSLYWAGLESGGGRANRQMDSIDFYGNKIKPFRERITDHLGQFLVPLFIPGKTNQQFRISSDASESVLAQYYITKQYRQYERWWQLRAITRKTFLEWINEAPLAEELTTELQDEYYSGSNNSQGLNVGAGEQGIEGGAAGGGGGGTAQPE